MQTFTSSIGSVYYDDEGRKRSKTFQAERDAKDFEAKVRLAKRTGEIGAIDYGRVTLDVFVERWWERYAIPNLEHGTLRSYRNHWHRHLLPRLGHYRLRELTPDVVAGFRADLERASVGAPTVRRTLAVLQSILQRAVEWREIGQNPVQLVRKPHAKRERAVRPLPPESIERLRAYLLERARPDDALLVSVLAYRGSSPAGLTRLLLGARAGRDPPDRGLGRFREPKEPEDSPAPRTVNLLRPLKQDLTEARLRRGRPRDSALVFPSAAGELWRDHDWRNWRRRVFQEAAAAVGLGRIERSQRGRTYAGIRPYDLRHSFASLRLWEGCSVPELAAELGNSPAITLSTYAHVIAELKHGAKRDAEEAIRAARAELFGGRTAHLRPTGQALSTD